MEKTWKTTTYHKNGKIEYTTQNKNGCRYGETFWFFDNGQLEQKAIYKYQVGNESGLRWEILEVFDINGNPLDKGTLKEGNGTWKSYDKNGNLTSTSIYKNGVKVD
jgi:MORN repeat variant.